MPRPRCEVADDAVEQVGITQETAGRRAFSSSVIWGVVSLGCHLLGDVLVLQFFQLQQHTAQVLLDDLFLDATVPSRLDDERPAVLGRVKVEGVHEHARAVADQDVDFEQVEGQVLAPATHAIAPVAEGQLDFVLPDLGFDPAGAGGKGDALRTADGGLLGGRSPSRREGEVIPAPVPLNPLTADRCPLWTANGPAGSMRTGVGSDVGIIFSSSVVTGTACPLPSQ